MLNLCDEANKRNIEINKEILQNLLGVPVIKATARSGKGISKTQASTATRCPPTQQPYTAHRLNSYTLPPIQQPHAARRHTDPR